MIQVEEVTQKVSSGDQILTILQDITFNVAVGESVAIVGASGAGKSTLLGLLAGLDLPTAGRITLDGQDLGAMSEDDRARARAGRVGFVFQSFQLLPAFSALENVMLPLELAGVDTPGPRARAALESVGLGARMSHRPHQLSGGEQQRVALARAFAPEPVVLFADEPTGNLDADTGGRVADLLFDLNARTRTTLVLVTHDQRLAARCERQLTLHDGRLTDASTATDSAT